MNQYKNELKLADLIAFRQNMHQHPESAFTEFQTQANIKQFLLKLDVPEANIRPCAKTGLVVDLKGIAEPVGDDRLIAYRADIDALIMDEANQHLPYRSTNGKAHMCGHDGHTTCLLGFAEIFQQNRNIIPRNKVARLLFQPAEECDGGAVDMILEGCLDGVQEVYGCHQWPTAKAGEIWCKEGTMMSQPIVMVLTLKGKGGHASEPQKFNNPVQCGAEFLSQISKELSEIQAQGKLFRFAWTCFNGGTSSNVIPDTAGKPPSKSVIKGMIRSLVPGLGEELFEHVRGTLNRVCEKFGVEPTLKREAEKYSITANTQTEASHVLRIGAEHFGKEKAHAGPCPVYASEDFGNYTLKVPGAFFFLSSGKLDEGNPMLHQSNFDFNDDLIEPAANFWWKLAVDRLML